MLFNNNIANYFSIITLNATQAGWPAIPRLWIHHWHIPIIFCRHVVCFLHSCVFFRNKHFLLDKTVLKTCTLYTLQWTMQVFLPRNRKKYSKSKIKYYIYDRPDQIYSAVGTILNFYNPGGRMGVKFWTFYCSIVIQIWILKRSNFDSQPKLFFFFFCILLHRYEIENDRDADPTGCLCHNLISKWPEPELITVRWSVKY